jgi:Icc-related predicted phosphoesterase
MHHVPFEFMVRRSKVPAWAFGNAFMGSVRIGKLIEGYEKIKIVVCGHTHIRMEKTYSHLTVINPGSTYTRKRFSVMEM